jgi:hypothetical protein
MQPFLQDAGPRERKYTVTLWLTIGTRASGIQILLVFKNKIDSDWGYIYILTDISSQWNRSCPSSAQIHKEQLTLKEQSNLPIDLLAKLAREYQNKHRELEEAVQNTPPEELPQQLKVLAESATDRFRLAQMQIAQHLTADTGADIDGVFQILTVLFRCFDEMRIVLQLLLEHYPRRDARD